MHSNIRFACIEYQTKTGRIWRHTAARPNYLCDPQKEIDPTSFGCYTSALAGEHIPLAPLRAGTLFTNNPLRRWWRAQLARFSFPSPASYSLRYLQRFNTLLVVYQFGGDQHLIEFMQRVRREFPHTIIASTSSPPWGKLMEYWQREPEATRRYADFLAASHFNMNVVRSTLPFYRFAFTTPSLYLPQPYPSHFAFKEAGRKTDSQGKPIVYIAGDTTRPQVILGQLLARALKKQYPRLRIRLTRVPQSPLNNKLLRNVDHEVVPFLPWRQQLRALAQCRLVINTDMWWTRGRVPADCAAAGVPCVGTGSDAQRELWPALQADYALDLPRLFRICLRLLEDRSFYQRVVAQARERLRAYEYAPTRERFAAAVALARRNELSRWRDPVWRDNKLILSIAD
jgi:glycosyltransferase involved in cell wall biosynthesis